MNLLADLLEFVHDHRPHGPMTADATEPAWNGYVLTVACPWGVVFEWWVTPVDAAFLAGAVPAVSAHCQVGTVRLQSVAVHIALALEAFYAEHQRCGEIDAGVEDHGSGSRVWMSCLACGATLNRRFADGDRQASGC